MIVNNDKLFNFDHLHKTIFERLLDWNNSSNAVASDDNGQAINEYWFPPNHVATFALLYGEFCELLQISPYSDGYKVQKHSHVTLYDKLNGWECGLYQVLDFGREDICKALPILLTAYCYNYAREKIPFVQNFLKQGIPNSWKSQISGKPNVFYIGAELDDDFQVDQDELDDDFQGTKSKTKASIARLLYGYAQTDENILQKYARCFFFEDLEIVQTTASLSKTMKFVDAEYIIPSRGKTVFLKRVNRRPWKTLHGDSEERVKWEIYRGENFEFVVDELRELGLIWMLVVYTVASGNIKFAKARNKRPDFACEPDLYVCYRYLASLINNGIVPETKYDCLDESKRNAAIARDLKKELQFK